MLQVTEHKKAVKRMSTISLLCRKKSIKVTTLASSGIREAVLSYPASTEPNKKSGQQLSAVSDKNGPLHHDSMLCKDTKEFQLMDLPYLSKVCTRN
jgi:hypothetical protein